MQNILQKHRTHIRANYQYGKEKSQNLNSKQNYRELLTNLNFAILGYKMNCLLIIRHHNSSIDEIAKYLYQFGNVYLGINAIGGMSVFGIIVRPGMEEEIRFLKETSHRNSSGIVEKDGKAFINIRDIFVGYHTLHFKLIETNLKIIRYAYFPILE